MRGSDASRGAVTIGAENYVVTDDTPTLAAGNRTGNYVLKKARVFRGTSAAHLRPLFHDEQTGSGLGLSSAYSINKSHGGHITAESTVAEELPFVSTSQRRNERPSHRPENPAEPLKGAGADHG